MDKLSRLTTSKGLLAGLFFLLAAIFAWVDGAAWSRRTGWDIVSYLDLGDAFLKGDWKAALSSYWSPLYGIVFGVLHKICGDLTSELDLLKLFNFSIFLLLAVAFGCFTQQLRKALESFDPESKFLLTGNLLTVVLYTSFIYLSLAICGIRYKTPDMMSALVCMVIFCVWLPSVTRPISYGRALLLGVLFGIAYLTKNSLANWSALVILCFAINRKLYQITIKQLVCMAAAAGITILSWAVPVSLNVGHPTLTDTLTVARSWMWTLSPGLRQVHGRGPTFKHPTREFFTNPDVYEFATPFDVSYSPWYAPAYWFEGVPFHFSISYYLGQLADKIPQLMVSYFGVLLVGFGLLWLTVRRSPFSAQRLRVCLPIIVPNCLGLLAFALFFEHEGRYLAPYTLPLFAALFSCLRVPEKEAATRWQVLIVKLITVYMALVSVLMFTLQFYFFSSSFANYLKAATKLSLPPSPPLSAHEATISALVQLGIGPGDRVARVSTLGHGEFYWIRGGRYKVVAECVDPAQFAQAPVGRRQELYQKLKEFGVKAIVEDWSPDQEEYPVCKDPGWINVAGTRNWIYKL